MAISRVKKISGLLFKPNFPLSRLQKPQRTSGDLDIDNERRRTLTLGQLPEVDLTAYNV